ncbi:MAG: hypothetical protein HY921_13085 [Elusimicrobia bacterium]|nr:hypothetical protein [Elusimicrobiota bacterium]
MSRLDLLVLTADRPRHRYFAAELSRAFPNSRWLSEASAAPSPGGAEGLSRHFQRFEEAEARFFEESERQNQALLLERLARQIPRGGLNQAETVEFIKGLNPRFIAVHGTGIIREDLIRAFPGRLVNLHAGLSPYYRGTGTNVWPFYNRELEYVGMTVHYIDAGIDSGDIILQGRPVFKAEDDTHTIGCKNVVLGTGLMGRVIERCLAGGSPPAVRQDKSQGRLYLKKQFTEEIVVEIERFIASGGVREYAKAPRQARIVSW